VFENGVCHGRSLCPSISILQPEARIVNQKKTLVRAGSKGAKQE